MRTENLWKLWGVLSLAYAGLRGARDFILDEITWSNVATSQALRFFEELHRGVWWGPRDYWIKKRLDHLGREVSFYPMSIIPREPRMFLYRGVVPLWVWIEFCDRRGPLCKIQYLRGTLRPEVLSREYSDYCTSVENDRCTFFADSVGFGDNGGMSIRPLRVRPGDLDALWLSKEMAQCLEELRHWKNNSAELISRGLPWKRGYLFYGPPGTGKTSLTIQMARLLEVPLFSLVLSSMDDEKFVEAWSHISYHGPRVVLLEDVDSVFHGTRTVSKECSLTWSRVLNTLDGVSSNDGCVFIVTTNHPDKLDPALARVGEDGNVLLRPGRIDRAIRFGVLPLEGRWKVARRILRGFPEEVLEELCSLPEEYTPAMFQELCTRVFLEEFWRADPRVHRKGDCGDQEEEGCVQEGGQEEGCAGEEEART